MSSTPGIVQRHRAVRCGCPASPVPRPGSRRFDSRPELFLPHPCPRAGTSGAAARRARARRGLDAAGRSRHRARRRAVLLRPARLSARSQPIRRADRSWPSPRPRPCPRRRWRHTSRMPHMLRRTGHRPAFPVAVEADPGGSLRGLELLPAADPIELPGWAGGSRL